MSSLDPQLDESNPADAGLLAETGGYPTAESPELAAEDPPVGGWDEPAPTTGLRRGSTLVACAAVGAVLAWTYDTQWIGFWNTWTADPNYSHGFLVPLVAAWVAWRRGGRPETAATRPRHWAWLLLVVTLATKVFFSERGSNWLEAMTMLPALGCLALTLGGWGLLRRVWPAVAYLFFMIPLPQAFNEFLARPLQNLATSASVTLLKFTGLWVIAEGNVIFIGEHPLTVAEACNGLSMMMSLAAVAVALTLVVKMSPWLRVVVLLSAMPVALASNVLRIVATAWAVRLMGAERGMQVAHDLAGWLMMPLALALVGLELAVLTWLFVEREVIVQPMLLGQPIVHGQHRAGGVALEGEIPLPGLPSRRERERERERDRERERGR